MIFRDFRDLGSIATTSAVAIGRIDVERMHAAEVYVAPAIGELYDCRYWHNHSGSYFYGHWVDVERAHAMLAAVRAAMERDFLHFSADDGPCRSRGANNPRALAAPFSEGMGQRLSERVRRLKAGRTLRLLAHGKDRARELARRCRLALAKAVMRRTPPSGTLAYAAGVEAGSRLALLDTGRARGAVSASRLRGIA